MTNEIGLPPGTARRPPERTLGDKLYRGALVAVLAGSIAVPLGLVAMPYLEWFNDMAVQPRGDPQRVYGRIYGRIAGTERPVEQPPAAGTMPIGHSIYPFTGIDIETAKRAGEGLKNPIPPTVENLRRGQAVYATFCYPCHGRFGEGDGPVTGAERYPAPPSLTSSAVRGYADGRIFHIITKGLELMPSYEIQIPPEDRWKAVHFVRVLRFAIDAAGAEEKR